jgi:hypothetical protein
VPKRSDDPKNYKRRPLSNYEGFKRLDGSLEKLEKKDRAREKVCEVCHCRCRAWRIVPATAGSPIASGETPAGKPQHAWLKGNFLVCCDAGPDGCAAQLLRAGVHIEELRQRKLRERAAALGIALVS